jgi:hypothetical protein
MNILTNGSAHMHTSAGIAAALRERAACQSNAVVSLELRVQALELLLALPDDPAPLDDEPPAKKKPKKKAASARRRT